MTKQPPILSKWYGLKPPEIRTAAFLQRYIPKDIYSQVYCILKTRSHENVIIEATR
ncbi:MAG: hypothetical protein H0X30_15930 [Anaerolineae bacterium]|nr:hypothetical protein [Anaerolineae bacterium]